MRRFALLFLTLALAACTTNARRIDQLAAAGGMSRETFQAGLYTTLIYMKRGDAGPTAPLVIFFEGDGRPWQSAIEPGGDPTTRHPIALELALRTPAPIAYITRPCYQELRDASCTLDQWTTARYSNEIVESLASSVREAARRMNSNQVVLVGYSGGGTLAVLIAERLDNATGVVTIAANLDTDAWTTHHDYPPLTRSLNPTLSDRTHGWPELHLVGVRDEIVPPSTVARYFERRASAHQWQLDDSDHVCCWIERWQELWPRILRKLEQAGERPLPAS